MVDVYDFKQKKEIKTLIVDKERSVVKSHNLITFNFIYGHNR